MTHGRRLGRHGWRSLVGIGIVAVVSSAMILALPTSASAASVQVPGSIRDHNGQPLPNTQIYISIVGGQGQNILTDESGVFSFTAQTGDEVDARVDAFVENYSYRYIDRFTVHQNTTADFIEGFRTSLHPTIVGTAGDDVLTGTSGRDIILGLDGDDTIVGLGGSDVIIGGDGNDQIQGGPGGDSLSGGDGDDALAGNGGDDSLRGWDGEDLLEGDGGADDLGDDDNGDDTNTLRGGPGDDRIFLGYPALPGSHPSLQVLKGGDGNDTIYASPEVRVNAGAGDDLIYVTSPSGGDLRVNCGDGNDVVMPNNYGVPDQRFNGCETIIVVA